MAGTCLLERLTASDLFLLLWEDYGWCTDIGGLAILDGTSLLDDEGRVRADAVRRHLEPKLHLVPRFRQLLYRPRLGLGWPLWADAPSFDLAGRGEDVQGLVQRAMVTISHHEERPGEAQGNKPGWMMVPLEVFPLLPSMGNLTLVVAALSYAGQLNLIAAADRDSCPDVEVFTHGVRAALDDLARSALAPATRAGPERTGRG